MINNEFNNLRVDTIIMVGAEIICFKLTDFIFFIKYLIKVQEM